MSRKILLLLLCTIAMCANSKDKAIYVNLSTQTLKAIEGGKVIISGNISSGMIGRETPTGTYYIGEKKKDHRSTLWPKPHGGAHMPYMLRLGSSAYSLHLGNLPGYPASHGCIRMEKSIASKVFNWASVGVKVRVYGKTPKKGRFKKKILREWRDIGSREQGTGTAADEVGSTFGDIITGVKEERPFKYIEKRAYYR